MFLLLILYHFLASASTQSVLTTVQPAGHADAPLLIVELVPSAEGHLKVPLADTFVTQLLENPDHAENATSIIERLVQSLNMML